MASAAERYEAAYGGTGIPEEQKAERMERIDFRREYGQNRPRRRTVGSIVVPDLPWLKGASDGD